MLSSGVSVSELLNRIPECEGSTLLKRFFSAGVHDEKSKQNARIIPKNRPMI